MNTLKRIATLGLTLVLGFCATNIVQAKSMKARQRTITHRPVHAKIAEIKGADFEKFIKNHRLVVAQFSAPWCNVCKEMQPLVQKVANQFGRDVRFVRIDIDKAPELKKKHGVMGVPTFCFFEKGLMVHRHVGSIDEKSFTSLVQQLVHGRPANPEKTPLMNNNTPNQKPAAWGWMGFPGLDY